MLINLRDCIEQLSNNSILSHYKSYLKQHLGHSFKKAVLYTAVDPPH